MESGWVGEKEEVVEDLFSIHAIDIVSHQRHEERLIFWKDS